MTKIRLGLTAAMVGLFFLTGCSQDSAAQTGTAPGEVEYEAAEIDEADASSSAEDEFLLFVKRNAPVGYAASDDREVLAYGYGICKLLDGGATVVEIATEINKIATAESQSFAEMAQVSIVGAPRALCPEHLDTVTQQLEELGL